MPQDLLSHLRQQLLIHPVYTSIHTLDALHVYMQHHVFAVWDFMSILKRLQQDLTVTRVPWVPADQPSYARLVNEIVLAEESDHDGTGSFKSHFELYVDAMGEAGADTSVIENFVSHVRTHPETARTLLSELAVPESVREFVTYSLTLAEQGKTHEVCAVFFYGREDIIPAMFQQIIAKLNGKNRLQRFHYYLERHVELDGEQHGPWAQELLTQLIGGDPKKADEAWQAARRALEHRIRLWNGVVDSLQTGDWTGKAAMPQP